MSENGVTRRDFVADAGKLALGAMIVPRYVLGGVGYQAPSDTLNVAIVGAGGQGMHNALALVSENIVAVCDVDFGYVDRQMERQVRDRDGKPRPDGVKLQEKFAKATHYADYREMLSKQKDLDAVVVATPDHAHAVIAKAAMDAGKHVYVQKPLTHSVQEARMLRELARSSGVVTQMGNQGHSSDDARLINEWVQGGVIGPVREVHVWTNRPIWPQGLPRPLTAAAMQQGENATSSRSWNQRAINQYTAAAMGGDFPVPDTLDWNLYMGPVPQVPYHPIYHPFNWRGWLDFGVGALGDMGAHLIDHSYWALGLDLPTSIEATSTPWGGSRTDPASYPLAMTVHYEFPARGAQPPVKLSWYDGGLMPPRPATLPDDVVLSREGGAILIGDRGILVHETYGGNPHVYPEPLMVEARAVPATYQRITTSHEMNWANACKGQGSATSPFEYAARLTEVMLLGIVALRTGQGSKIMYDGANMRVTNNAEANKHLKSNYE